ncbi:hypothetical protein [Melioribacter sp. OK-6-Me]|uniref:hypothetical protein n=1 Tax=unclassified Melioribacter TaxID=2627329 RepID=UPI003ED8FF9C
MREIVSIEGIEDGMVLAEDVKNKYGHLLIPAETVLSQKHKLLLKTWGITVVSIKSEDEQITFTEEEKKTEREELLKQINWTIENEYEEDLINMVVEHKLEQIKFYDNKRKNS